jgi:diadenosine tetraphosphate (Ap4A) HIT family hydrolase
VFHYRKTHKRYSSFPKPAACSFCEDDLAGRAIRETEHLYVMPNRVSYDLWEHKDVTDHLLVIPKKHVIGFSELDDIARLEIMDIFAEYELDGYNVYARGQGSSHRSVHHQHSHLIKTGDTVARGTLAIWKPYFLIKF